ncbi:MAG: SDR family oxidoreductase, partial [Alphaproteobacteria bacterium]|nr:SDR family oxidoreductase [Alphaproteobacteria bacterium]
QTVRHNVTINCLLPGPFDTDRLRGNITFRAKQAGKTEEAMAAAMADLNPAGRFGDPAEFGDACAFLCSAQAGFVTGQHFLMDGGNHRATF